MTHGGKTVWFFFLSKNKQEQGKHFDTAQGRGSFPGVLLDFWVAKSACKVAVLLPINHWPVLGILSRPSKDLSLLGLGESPVAGISVPGLITQGSCCCLSFIGLCFSAQAQSIKRSLLPLGPGGSSLAIEQWPAKRMSCSVPTFHQRFIIGWILSTTSTLSSFSRRWLAS
jgi:hypothetical protein